MVIDLHVHTRVYSSCSILESEEAIREAKKIGLEGLCFTEHNLRWEHEALQKLSQKENFPLFCGVEVETREGHLLVFGVNKSFAGITPLDELRELVKKENGVMIIAHPFRGFLLFGFADLSLQVEMASQRQIYQQVEAMEILSGKAMKKENDLAQKVSKRLKLKGVGGSDAHAPGEIGRGVTIFKKPVIKNEAELITEIKKGEYEAVYWLEKNLK
jgi:histidinol phosphatase-like PHP family hydrolase